MISSGFLLLQENKCQNKSTNMFTKHKEYYKQLEEEVIPSFTNVAGGDPRQFISLLTCRFPSDEIYDDAHYEKTIQYLKETVIPHKIAVYEAGKGILNGSLGASEFSYHSIQKILSNLWIHDLSKFSKKEAYAYALYNRKTGEGKEAFELAWHHHKMNNPHHPEYWLNPNRSGKLEPLPMPEIFIIEMIADWIGAGKTYGSSLAEWMPDNIGKFMFSSKSTNTIVHFIKKTTGIMVYPILEEVVYKIRTH